MTHLDKYVLEAFRFSYNTKSNLRSKIPHPENCWILSKDNRAPPRHMAECWQIFQIDPFGHS